MKRIKSFKSFELSEKLGVFEGNIEFAELIYDRLLEEFKKEYGGSLEDYADANSSRSNVILSFPVTDIYNNLLRQKIEKNKTRVDLKSDIVITLILDQYKDVSKPDYLKMRGASFSFDIQRVGWGASIKYSIKRNSENKELKYPNRYLDILDYLVKEKSEVIKAFAHEAKHLIDSILGKIREDDQKEYLIVSNASKGYALELLGSPTPEAKLFREFLFDNYFITRAENLVRPTEIATHMKLNGTKKDEFLSFLDESPEVKKLREISKRSYSELRNIDPEKLRSFLDKLGKGTKAYVDDEAFYKNFYIDKREGMSKADYRQTDVYKKDLDDTIRDFRKKSNVILKNTLENLEGASDEEIKKKSEKLFSDAEKKVRGESEKMLRKIYKLYDLAG